MNALIEWDAVEDTDLDYYTVYYGTAPGVYTANSDVQAPDTSLQLNGLPDGVQVYVAISATDAEGAESALSDPITIINPYVDIRTA